ncbi:hypothetical protein COO60DRAFT_763655 [Scenedesmus sp. NREL 46B-D3]|nr:hypothetical protein COO60DRAFT_763655 [Scenedesmus sp. NREL 46B-D3]
MMLISCSSSSMCSLNSCRPTHVHSVMVLLIAATSIGLRSCRAAVTAGSMQLPVLAKRPTRSRQRAVPFHRCGTAAPQPYHRLLLEQRHTQATAAVTSAANIATGVAAAETPNPFAGLASSSSSSSSSRSSSQRVYVIRTYVHNVLVADSTGAFFGAVTPWQVRLQLAALNAAYNTSAQQAGVSWLYKLANITNTSVALGADMCNEQTDMQLKVRLRQGGATALNLYVTDMAQCGVLGAASWPWHVTDGSGNSSRALEGSTSVRINGSSSTAGTGSSSVPGLRLDGVTVHYDTLPLGQLDQYNTGGTAVHELGTGMGCCMCLRTAAVCQVMAWMTRPTAGHPKTTAAQPAGTAALSSLRKTQSATG